MKLLKLRSSSALTRRNRIKWFAALRLPHGTGKVFEFSSSQRRQRVEAKEAGADFVGADDLVEKIKGGWLDFDKVIATPDMMPKVGPIARILGPRGLMPNPKVGTVTPDVAKAIADEKAGKVEFRVDKGAILHVAIGKLGFDAKQLVENFEAFLEQVLSSKAVNRKRNLRAGHFAHQHYGTWSAS